MWTAKWVLDTYENGDESVRWDLYMNYPELRSYFDEVESRQGEGRLRQVETAAGRHAALWWSYCCRLVRG